MQTFQGSEEKQTCEVCPDNKFTKVPGSIRCEEPTEDTNKLHTPKSTKITYDPASQTLELTWEYNGLSTTVTWHSRGLEVLEYAVLAQAADHALS